MMTAVPAFHLVMSLRQTPRPRNLATQPTAMRTIITGCIGSIEALSRVWKGLIIRIVGGAWKLTEKAVEELREKKYPKLLM